MAFIPKFPTWHNTVTVYRLVADEWVEQGQILGQLYTPLRNQDDEEGGLMYFEMPKAQLPSLAPWLLPRDSFHGVADVIEFALPGGNGNQAYRVREVRGRWTGFPNEHLLCDLQRMRFEEWDLESHNVPVVPPPPAPVQPPTDLPNKWILEIDCIADGTCDHCEDLNGEYTLSLNAEGHWRSPPFAWECAESGQAYWLIEYWDSSTTALEQFLLIARLHDLLTDTYYGTWQDHVTAWDHESPLPLPLHDLNALCTMGDCLTVKPPPDPGFIVGWNTSLLPYVDSDGNEWVPDSELTIDGDTTRNPFGGDYANTTEDYLYSTERVGEEFEYTVPAADGTYTLRLLFAESFWSAAGQRVFDVLVDGVTVIDDLDIFDEAGGGWTAYDAEIEIEVTGGSFTLGFVASVDWAMIRAFALYPVT